MAVPKKQKVQVRGKMRDVYRKRAFVVVRVLIVLGVLGAGVHLGAQRLSRVSFLPIKALRADMVEGNSAGAYASWREPAVKELDQIWKGKNRLTFMRRYFTLRRELMARYPFIKDVRVYWWNLAAKGELRVALTFRQPVAFSKEKNKSACLDAALNSFPCPQEINTNDLISVAGNGRDLLRLALKVMPSLNQAIPAEDKVVQLEAVSDQVIFKTLSNKDFRFNRSILSSKDRLEISLDRLKTVLLDLNERGESYNAMDLTLADAGEGRIIASLSNEEGKR